MRSFCTLNNQAAVQELTLHVIFPTDQQIGSRLSEGTSTSDKQVSRLSDGQNQMASQMNVDGDGTSTSTSQSGQIGWSLHQ